MPSFAELRAKAEAAANSAKSTANSKLAAYRGDEQPTKPQVVYKPPPPRPIVKPDIPHATRPLTPDHEVDTDTAADADTDADDTATLVADLSLSPEIQRLIKNKALFFEFLDEVCTYLLVLLHLTPCAMQYASTLPTMGTSHTKTPFLVLNCKKTRTRTRKRQRKRQRLHLNCILLNQFHKILHS